MFNVKWTPAQSSLGHFALSLLVSIIMSVFTAGAQYLYSGKFNMQELAVIASAAFIAAFSRGIISLESNPNLMPSILDAVNELRALTVQQPLQAGPLMQAPAQVPPVHIEIHPGAAQPVQVQPTVRQLNAIPPRPAVQPPIQMPVQPPPDIAQLNTAQVPTPPLNDMPQRSFSNSALMAVVPQQAGQ